jgi:hypothetical protein
MPEEGQPAYRRRTPLTRRIAVTGIAPNVPSGRDGLKAYIIVEIENVVGEVRIAFT